jgi:hypothetical protein
MDSYALQPFEFAHTLKSDHRDCVGAATTPFEQRWRPTLEMHDSEPW